MRPPSLLSRSSIAGFFSLLQIAKSQSAPGGEFFNGNGAPGAGVYTMVDDYQPSFFFDKFEFFTGGDPTNGHVKYVDRETAERNSYAQTGEGAVRMNVDSSQLFPRGGQGRPALRLVSSNAYTHGLFVFDVAHMPTGCGTWPAYWLLGNGPEPWPKYGEIGKRSLHHAIRMLSN